MKVKIILWAGMDLISRTYPCAESPLECLREALEEYDALFGHAPSDGRIKVR